MDRPPLPLKTPPSDSTPASCISAFIPECVRLSAHGENPTRLIRGEKCSGPGLNVFRPLLPCRLVAGKQRGRHGAKTLLEQRHLRRRPLRTCLVERDGRAQGSPCPSVWSRARLRCASVLAFPLPLLSDSVGWRLATRSAKALTHGTSATRFRCSSKAFLLIASASAVSFAFRAASVSSEASTLSSNPR